MCGRYSLDISFAELLAHFKNLHLVVGEIDSPLPRYNLAPSDLRPNGLPVIRRAPVIHHSAAQTYLDEWAWRLIPRWNHGQFVSYNTINAKSETVKQSRMYQGPWLDGQRCLIPATGVIEWQASATGAKRPYHLQLPDQKLFCLAGLWEASRARWARSAQLFRSYHRAQP